MGELPGFKEGEWGEKSEIGAKKFISLTSEASYLALELFTLAFASLTFGGEGWYCTLYRICLEDGLLFSSWNTKDCSLYCWTPKLGMHLLSSLGLGSPPVPRASLVPVACVALGCPAHRAGPQGLAEWLKFVGSAQCQTVFVY